MSEVPYSNRELDVKLQSVVQVSTDNRAALEAKIDNLQNVVELRIADMRRDNTNAITGLQEDVTAIKHQTTYTNGKVKKIIIALVLIGGIIIGQAFPTVHDVIQLLGGSISL
jgi:translation elongation factor EF-Tu-like GTPase